MQNSTTSVCFFSASFSCPELNRNSSKDGLEVGASNGES